MSRIHEALQRAYLERGKAPVSGDLQVIDQEVGAGIDEPEPLVATAEIVLHDIKQHRWSPSHASLPTLADRGKAVEQFRSLRSHIYQARYEAPLKTVLIASGLPSEGKSFIAANLAISLARNSVHNILLIDGDLRRPTLHTLFGAPNSPGLSEYLKGNANLADIMQCDRKSETGEATSANGISNLTLIASGNCTDNSSELVANPRMKDLIESVSPSFDWIVIDAPPVLAVSDAVELARTADGVLLVARGACTPYEAAQHTKSAFLNSRVLGFVLNAVKQASNSTSANYYNYYGESGAGRHSEPREDSAKKG